MDALRSIMKIAGSGLDAQSTRLRIGAENLANARSTATVPGGDPYARRTVTFDSEMDRAIGARLVRARPPGIDPAPFRIEHDPSHPAADEAGNVKYPNVDPLVELADIREANRGYEANVQMVKQARGLTTMMIDLLRSGT